MTTAATERFYAEIAASTATLASIVDGADLTRPVPTCPDWTLRQLATHVGRAHRWAGEIVATRSAESIPFRAVPDGRLPDDPGLLAARRRGPPHQRRPGRGDRARLGLRQAPARQLLGPPDGP